jgi:hypothetical protein
VIGTSPRRATLHASVLAAAAVCAVAWPLATYTLTLAAFGLAHVLSELRFVALRFGPRLASDLRRALVGLVVLVALGRLARRFDVVDAFTADIVELLLGIALVVVVVPTLARAGRARVLLATSVGVLLALGIAFSPIHALLAIAVLHNLTPVGFLAEALEGGARRRALATAAVVFAGVPVVILSGLPFAALQSAGLAAPELVVLPAGPLALHMRAYLPDDLLSATWALHAFSACVFLQCAHYLAVIDVLPRLVAAPGPRFGWFLVVAGAVAFVPFALDFIQARQGYGVLAAVHAWIEVPLLLLATVAAAAYTRKSR